MRHAEALSLHSAESLRTPSALHPGRIVSCSQTSGRRRSQEEDEELALEAAAMIQDDEGSSLEQKAQRLSDVRDSDPFSVCVCVFGLIDATACSIGLPLHACFHLAFRVPHEWAP